ncbi:MAG TPA: hypothetical protein VG476_16705 [Acidimicrobiales bacterium]|nr:hypothetical protein [Acidimicrobiales bacterium]
MERFGEGARGPGPRGPYQGDPSTRQWQPTAPQASSSYEYYPGEATLRASIPTVRARPPWSRAMLLAGIGAIVVGAWAAIVPFVGPSFGYTLGASGAWKLTADHLYLQLAPGAAGVLAGLVFLGFVPGRDRALYWRGMAVVAGLLAAAAGAWLVIGPDAYTVIRHVGANGRTLPTRSLGSLATQVGYYLGPGVLLAVFGGIAIGRGPHRCGPAR